MSNVLEGLEPQLTMRLTPWPPFICNAAFRIDGRGYHRRCGSRWSPSLTRWCWFIHGLAGLKALRNRWATERVSD